jgi:hypothetical protein
VKNVCGEIEHYVDECLEKLAKSNQSQNQQLAQPIPKVHEKQVQGKKLKKNYIQGV